MPEFSVWHLSSVQLKLRLPFHLGYIQSYMFSVKFIWVLSFGVWKPCNNSVLPVTPLMKGQARNVTWHFCSSLLFIEHSLTCYPKCHPAKSTKDPFDCLHIPKLCYASLNCPVLMPARLSPLSSICFFFPYPSPFRCYALLSLLSSSSSPSVFLSLILLLARTILL